MFVAPPEKEVEWTDTASRARSGSSAASGGSSITSTPARARTPASPAGHGARRRRARDAAQDARHDQRVTHDIDPRMHLNTAISALMEMVNELYAFAEQRGIRPTGREDEPPPVIDRAGDRGGAARGGRSAGADAVAVHAAHGRGAVGAARAHEAASSPPAGRRSTRRPPAKRAIEIPVQVNGKVRGRVVVPADASEQDIEAAALAAAAVQAILRGQAGRQGDRRARPAGEIVVK